MSERPYLSIGDVLTLLREEFSDVTISKIRFLESRGLLIPERTPSGYRKFYDHDVERLRWILRQQRENFLPLKVIKGRLEGREPSSEPAQLFEVVSSAGAGASEAVAVARPPGRGAVVQLEDGSSRSSAAGAGRRTQTPVLSGAHQTPWAGAGAGTIAPLPAPEHADLEDRGSSDIGESRLTVAAGSLNGPVRSSAEAGGGATRGSGHSETTGPGMARKGGGGSRRTVAAALSDSPADAGTDDPVAGPAAESGREALTGASLTAEELAHTSGLDVHQIEELESYGLIESHVAAGVKCFGDDALVVAGLAAGLGRFGIEARHLRIFKHAAERQASLYSQIVMPLLRQRNPDARRRAHDDLVRLTELGASMQACFARAALHDLTSR